METGLHLQQIWNLLDSFDEVLISHTLRKGNGLADYLANQGCDKFHQEANHLAGIINIDVELENLIATEKKSCKREDLLQRYKLYLCHRGC